MLLARVLPVAATAGVRRISTTSRLHLREMFRELKDVGFAPRFRDQHTRMIAKRPNPKDYFMFDEYCPLIALVIAYWWVYRQFLDERRRDLDRMLEFQFNEIDDTRMERYEQYYADMLAKV